MPQNKHGISNFELHFSLKKLPFRWFWHKKSSTFVFDAKVLLNKRVGKDRENAIYIRTNKA